MAITEQGYAGRDGPSNGGHGAPPPLPGPVVIDLLVIEPSVSVRKTLERLLESAGYTMRGVTRMADALGQASRQRPDLVLSEVTLPDGGGLELCQQFSVAGLPVLLMSTLPNDRLRRDSLEAGALELLSKPFTEDLLLRRLAYHLKLPTPARPPPPGSPTLLNSLMTRPGILGVTLLNGAGELLEQVGQPIADPLYRAFLPQLRSGGLTAATAAWLDDGEAQGRPVQGPPLQCAQLEYPDHCLLLFRLPAHPPGILICLIQNSSYASLIKYYLRSSPYIRL